MIQIICGHRAEIIQMRIYGILNYVRNPVGKSALRKIPSANQLVFSAEHSGFHVRLVRKS